MQVTQLGHVKDLASAFVKVLGNAKAKNQVCSQCITPTYIMQLVACSYVRYALLPFSYAMWQTALEGIAERVQC